MTAALAYNVAAFQLGWFALVLGAAHGHATWGALAAASIIAVHVLRAARPVDELMLVLAAGALGATFEHLLYASGLVGYGAAVVYAPTVPLWMVLLWMLMATTVNASLRWLRGRPLLAACAGAVGAPLAYWSGEALGALTLTQPLASPAAIAAGWSVLLPLLLGLGRRFDGYGPDARLAASGRRDASY